jgi:hypothetical protein
MVTVLRRHPLTKRQRAILDSLRRSDVPLRLRDLAHALSDLGEVNRRWGIQMVRTALQGLLLRGVVVRVGTPFRKLRDDRLEQYQIAKGVS